MVKTFYAITIRMEKITADLDAYGMRIAGSGTEEELLASRYSGSLPKSKAMILYDILDKAWRMAP